MTIEEMQNAILYLGWQFKEHMFNDELAGNRLCSIEFTQDKSPHALSTFPKPTDCIGWGRFQRHWAWHQAYDCIVKGIKDS